MSGALQIDTKRFLFHFSLITLYAIQILNTTSQESEANERRTTKHHSTGFYVEHRKFNLIINFPFDINWRIAFQPFGSDVNEAKSSMTLLGRTHHHRWSSNNYYTFPESLWKLLQNPNSQTMGTIWSVSCEEQNSLELAGKQKRAREGRTSWMEVERN